MKQRQKGGWLDTDTKQPEYKQRLAVLEFIQGLLRLMREDGVSRSKLAKRYKAEPPYITRVLSGSENLTLETMSKFAAALDATLHVVLTRDTEWLVHRAQQKSNEPVKLASTSPTLGSQNGGKLYYFPGADTLPVNVGMQTDAAGSRG